MAEIFAIIGELVTKIPSEFWAALFGSTLSLAAVWITNRANDQRQRQEFAHQRDMQSRDRDLAMRKEVYMAAAEAIAAGNTSIAQISDVNTPVQECLGLFREKSGALARVPVVANEPTLRASMVVSRDLAMGFLSLLGKRMALDVCKANIDFLDGQIATWNVRSQQVLDLMRNYNLEGRDDKRYWDALTADFQFESNRIRQGNEERQKIAHEMLVMQLALCENSTDMVATISNTAAGFMIEARNELNIPIDDKAYRQIVAESVAAQKEQMTKFLEFLAAEIKRSSDPKAADGPPQRDPE